MDKFGTKGQILTKINSKTRIIASRVKHTGQNTSFLKGPVSLIIPFERPMNLSDNVFLKPYHK